MTPRNMPGWPKREDPLLPVATHLSPDPVTSSATRPSTVMVGAWKDGSGKAV